MTDTTLIALLVVGAVLILLLVAVGAALVIGFRLFQQSIDNRLASAREREREIKLREEEAREIGKRALDALNDALVRRDSMAEQRLAPPRPSVQVQPAPTATDITAAYEERMAEIRKGTPLINLGTDSMLPGYNQPPAKDDAA